MKSIETRYAGHLFRSRLEARWAAFFDLCGWQWTYEPFDWGGWIPDFQIGGMVVEVKPFSELEHFNAAIRKAWMCGRGMPQLPELLLVGVGPFCSDYDADCIGWIGEVDDHNCPVDGWGAFGTPWNFDLATIGYHHGSSIGLCAECGSYQDRITGHYDGHPVSKLGAHRVREMWGRAHEVTRWLPGKA